jgi:hypothetical protein
VALLFFAASSAHATDGMPTAAPEPKTAEAAPATETTPSAWGRYPVVEDGLYPIWEDTAETLGPGQFELGSAQVAGGLLRRLQVGLNPTYYIHRAPNLAVKVALYNTPQLKVAWRQSGVLLLAHAEEQFFASNSYTSRISNSKPLLALPSTLSGTWQPWEKARLHLSLTELPEVSTGNGATSWWSGTSLVTELLFLPGHSLLFHAGEVGLWRHDFRYLGASYRANYAFVVAQVGYFYRFYATGAEGAPLVTLAVML